jgi:DNA topoisomerase-1
MRTDSLRVADTAISAVRSFISKEYGKEYLPAKSLAYTKKNAQDAHEAIRPIDVTVTPEKIAPFVDSDSLKLYTLIWRRFVACQMVAAQYAQRAVTIQGGVYTFKVTGSTLLFDGFLKVYNSDEDEQEEKEAKIPAGLEEKIALGIKKFEEEQHFTQAPPRYTEASLIKEMQKEGIGRPSTYATIMRTIQAREYTALDTKKRFIPTELGMAVTKLLTDNLPKIMNLKFTAVMEEDLDKIAQGELERDALLREFYAAFSKDLDAFRGEKTKREVEPTELDCPECKQSKLGIRFGKAGAFLGCIRFPDCSFTSNFERSEDGTIKLVEAVKPQLLEEKCPQCGKPLRQMVGRFGPFISCSGYPECKYIHQKKAKFPCPTDGGDVIERSWKGKKFWGCKNYPKCKFSISGEIEEIICPDCKSPYLLKKYDKTGTITLTCPNKECSYATTIES